MSARSVIQAAKDAVLVSDLANRLSDEQGKHLRRAGQELVTRCLLPDHEDRTPSFYVNAEKNLWLCRGCNRGGDVVRLAQLAWEHTDDGRGAAMAAAELLMTFGHSIPEKPASWFARQKRQRPIREAISRERFNHLRRRLFRRFYAPALLRIEDQEERKAEAEILWGATDYLARLMVERLRGGRG